MSTIAKPDLKTQVGPVTENITGTDGIVPGVLCNKFNCKWNIADIGQFKNAAVFFIRVQVHGTDPESPLIPEESYSRLDRE